MCTKWHENLAMLSYKYHVMKENLQLSRDSKRDYCEKFGKLKLLWQYPVRTVIQKVLAKVIALKRKDCGQDVFSPPRKVKTIRTYLFWNRWFVQVILNPFMPILWSAGVTNLSPSSPIKTRNCIFWTMVKLVLAANKLKTNVKIKKHE